MFKTISMLIILAMATSCGQLFPVDNSFNCQNNYVNDPQDVWQTEAETRLYGGDCEDFAYIEFKKYTDAWMIEGTVDGTLHVWVERNGETLDSCYYGGERVIYSRFNRTCRLYGETNYDLSYCIDARDSYKWDQVLQREEDGVVLPRPY